MADILPPAPIDAPFASYNWTDWYKKVRDAINDAQVVQWSAIVGTPTTLAGYGITDAVSTARTISTTAPLTGGGDLSANRTLSITDFSGSTPGAVPTSPGGTTTFLRADGSWASQYVYVAPNADTEINSTSDVTIVSTNITDVVAGDQLIVDGSFTLVNNSGATRQYVFTLDFDGLFDIEFTTDSLNTSTIAFFPFQIRGVLDVRSSSLAYAMTRIDGIVASGFISGADSAMSATRLRTMGWGTTASDTTGTVTVDFKVRSASATATQTLRLHEFSVRKLSPT